jgi:hypothetical protein
MWLVTYLSAYPSFFAQCPNAVLGNSSSGLVGIEHLDTLIQLTIRLQTGLAAHETRRTTGQDIHGRRFTAPNVVPDHT